MEYIRSSRCERNLRAYILHVRENIMIFVNLHERGLISPQKKEYMFVVFEHIWIVRENIICAYRRISDNNTSMSLVFIIKRKYFHFCFIPMSFEQEMMSIKYYLFAGAQYIIDREFGNCSIDRIPEYTFDTHFGKLFLSCAVLWNIYSVLEMFWSFYRLYIVTIDYGLR